MCGNNTPRQALLALASCRSKQDGVCMGMVDANPNREFPASIPLPPELELIGVIL